RENGKPCLLEAAQNAKRVLIKFWPKDESKNNDIIEDLWRYEIRQLHRLKGLPGLGDYISSIVDSGKDERGFYLVLDADFRVPLSYIFKEKKTLSLNKEWIRNSRRIENRIKLWHNFIRIIKAIELLHSQGLLHRHLDKDSILTDPRSLDFDFQLTGFEWSLRVHAVSDKHNEYTSRDLKINKQYSFLSDWADLGFLIAELLNISSDRLINLQVTINDLVDETDLILDELILIRGLIGVMKLETNLSREAINGSIIIEKANTILKSLESLISKENSTRHIEFLFSAKANSEVTPDKITSVFNAIQYTINRDHGITISDKDIDECLDFITRDLSGKIYLSINKNRSNKEEILLYGEKLTYVLEKKRNGKTEDSDWNIAFCHAAYVEPPRQIKFKAKRIALERDVLKCIQFKSNNRYQGIYNSWDDLILELERDDNNILPNRVIVEGFAIYHLTEIAFAKSEIYPVTLISYDKDKTESKFFTVRIQCRQDDDHISTSLGIKPPAIRLHDNLENDRINSISWILTENNNFYDGDNEVTLDFIKTERNHEGVYEYIFTTNTLNPGFKKCFLIPSSVQGTIKQLSRRASSIDELSNHAELRSMLDDPYNNTIISEINNNLHSSFYSLDESKKDAFEKINKTLPIFLVQGPPGVGKTYLITTLVNQIFSNESESRIVLTAQSHSTVQHLYQEVTSSLDITNSKPLIVSCIKKDSDDDSDDISINQLDSLALEYIKRFIDSDIFDECTSTISKNSIISASRKSSKSDRYSLIKQILKSANMVFATTNSRQVEELISEKSQFDWSIMEETGKVTGVELLSPMLLSYRRLMIGDHKQLPPYATEKMREILTDINKLKNAIIIATDINNQQIKGDWIKERFTENFISTIDSETLEKLSSSAVRLHLLFESLVLEEKVKSQKYIDRYGDDRKHRKIASMLNFQHRMHPDIANLISSVFYDKKLKTEPSKEKFYRDANTITPFTFKPNSPLLNSPAIIWIDTPDVQQTKNNYAAESLPIWTNNLEKNTLLSVLEHLRVNSKAEKTPKLAIMSPYAKQVDLIKRSLDKKLHKEPNSLQIEYFQKPDDHSSFCSTVDGFQGAETDIVIVSMVRNNHHSYVRASLGFLLDSRRMNVLLSRAKYKMIIIGSFEFLKYWSDLIDKKEIKKGDLSNQFLVDLVNKLIEYEREGLLKKIDSREFKHVKQDKNKKRT
ncbi:TPA: AAA domain-containing protein, partial [Klebsiella pneumoniae]